MITFKIKIANKVLEINAFNETTKRYCKNFLSEENPDCIITMSEEDLINERTNSSDGKVYVSEEISALYRKIANLFVEDRILVFHGSSFKVNNGGFILTARSGVGKSTHSRLLNNYLGDEFAYINDDKPLLKINEEEIIVYSSPWNGKERRGNDISASLKSIIFLNRGTDNTYKLINNKEDIFFKLLSQTYLPKEKSKREKALKLLNILVKSIHFYEIYVNMDISSAKMTYEKIIKNS